MKMAPCAAQLEPDRLGEKFSVTAPIVQPSLELTKSFLVLQRRSRYGHQ
jgi:hypothetical protein